jgi:predicted PurR-regulated permease PerM
VPEKGGRAAEGETVDAELGPWTRRGIGFGTGIVIVAAVVAGTVTGLKIVAMVLVAILFASALAPLVDGVRARAPFGRTAATGLLFLAVGALVVALGVLLVLTAASQLGEIGARIPSVIASARAGVAGLPAPLAAALGTVLDDLDRSLRNTPRPTPDQVLGAGFTILDILSVLVTVATLIFFWLHERARLQRFVLAFLPLERRMGVRLAWNDVEDRLGHWVRGQLTLMVLMGITTGIAYTLLGLPVSLALGLAAGLFEAVPIVGPILGAIPAVLVAAAVRPDLVLAVAGIYLVVQLAESNVVVPVVMRNTVGLSPFIVIVSILVGGTLGGLFGAFIAVPVAASAEIVLERLQARAEPVGLEPGGAPAEAVAPDEIPDLTPAAAGSLRAERVGAIGG